MHTLFILNETYTNGFKSDVLDIISLVVILCGIFVILVKNPITSVLFLIGLFLSISSYLIFLGLNFIGISYILVYVGAVSILFLFILMLINIRISELLSESNNSIPLAFFISLIFYLSVYFTLPYSISIYNRIFNEDGDYLYKIINNNYNNNNNLLPFVTSKSWEGNISETTHITAIGNIMYSNYSMWILITSIILLLAMVGAIVITIKQK